MHRRVVGAERGDDGFRGVAGVAKADPLRAGLERERRHARQVLLAPVVELVHEHVELPLERGGMGYGRSNT